MNHQLPEKNCRQNNPGTGWVQWALCHCATSPCTVTARGVAALCRKTEGTGFCSPLRHDGGASPGTRSAPPAGLGLPSTRGEHPSGHSRIHSFRKNQNPLPAGTVWGPGDTQAPVLGELWEPDREAGGTGSLPSQLRNPQLRKPCCPHSRPPALRGQTEAGSGPSACSFPHLPSRP